MVQKSTKPENTKNDQTFIVLTSMILCIMVCKGEMRNKNNPFQNIQTLNIKTADCDFCGMTFFGAVSFKVVHTYIETIDIR